MKPAGSFIQIHYHARPGGVTSVMAHYSLAFRELCGNADGANLVACAAADAAGSVGAARMIDVKECGYRTFGSRVSFVNARNVLLRRIDRIVTSPRLPRPVYVAGHNLNLGKNCALSSAFAACARRCAAHAYAFRFFNVIHDFAEEGRADIMEQIRAVQQFGIPIWRDLYPAAPNLSFITLNSRNYRLLKRAGYSVRLLLNPVIAPKVPGPSYIHGRRKTIEALSLLAKKDGTVFKPSAPVVFYPSRVISRKNPVEAVLLSHFFFSSNLVLGMAGTNPADRALAAYLKRLCAQHRVAVVFDCGRIGRRLRPHGADPFPHLYRAADACITTSVLEGFGYALYEPWLYDKAVVGRIPAGAGMPRVINLSGLYARLLIPVEWISLEALKKRYYQLMRICFTGRAKISDYRSFSKRFEKLYVKDGGIDFGCLDSASQCDILQRLLASPELVSEWKRAFRLQTEALMRSWRAATCYHSPFITRNKSAVASLFSQKKFQTSLSRCFLGKFPVSAARPDSRIVSGFFCRGDTYRLLHAPHFTSRDKSAAIFA